MKLWWKRLLMLLAIPFLAVALTACPAPGDNGADADEPAIEGEAAPGGEEAEDDDTEDEEDED